MTKKEKLEALNQMAKNTLMETLNISITDVGDDFIEGTMPVNAKVHQPYGILHGGANIALAETLGSYLSAFNVDMTKYKAVGMQMNANHLRPKREGIVIGRAEFVKKGRTVHLVKIEISDESGKMLCYCHLTNAIVSNEYL